MRWEELTAPEFARAVRQARGLCIVPVGVIEKHGDHLPLGTDALYGHAVAARAAELEPAVVFPPYYFGQIPEARHQPGTIALSSRMVSELLGEVCAEIARNGLRKIALLNCHGGNRFLLPFTKWMLERERDYVVYLIDLAAYYPFDDPGWKAMKETAVDGHGGEMETSGLLVTHPKLVKMGAISSKKSGMPRKRLKGLEGIYTAIDWYADQPDHYKGDARAASLPKGRYVFGYQARKVAERLRAIKKDAAAPRLVREFYRRARRP